MPKSRSNGLVNPNDCRRGTVYREGYNRKVGNKRVGVKGNCIKATSQSGQKRSVQDLLYFAEKARSQERAKRKTQSKKQSRSCSKGKIQRVAYERSGYVRKAYTRKDGTKVKRSMVRPSVVPSGCVEDRGKVGHGKQLFHLEENVLGKFGYKDVKHMPKKARHHALNKALRGGIKPLPLFRRINALYVLNKNQDPKLAQLFKSDRDYVRSTSAYRSRSKSRTRSRTKSRSKNKYN